MKALVLIFAIILTAHAMSNRKISTAQKTRFEAISKSGTWAGFYLKLAEVQVLAGNPLDELIEAINDAAEDLDRKKQAAADAFERRTQQHEAEVARLLSSISNTKLLIEQIENRLDELAQEKQELEAANVRLGRENDGLELHIQEATAVRVQQRKVFEIQRAEHGEGIQTVEQCIQILTGLQGASFLQVKAAKKSLQGIHAKLQKSTMVDAHILMALVEMASNQEFADSDAVANVIAKFREIGNNLTQSLFRLVDQDKQQEASYQQDLVDSNNQINANIAEIASNNKALKVNAENTVQSNINLVIAKDQLATFEQELQDEKDRYENDKAVYADLVAEFEAEQAACVEAVEILGTADIPSYLSDRLDLEDGLATGAMDTVQQHGAGVEVFQEFDV